MKAGIVYLVGAGPGDPGLITVKGKEVLKQADCIIYDRLAAPELLEYAQDGCEMIYVGKENHHHTMKQDDINELLVAKAKEHARVVRLKGGDVYVFGRGGEEGIFMKEHGIAFEVVPGISSALAGLAYAGIPITHRGVAMGFHVVTAHNKRDELADIDFQAMANSTDTHVFLMGLSKLPEIVEGLVNAGMRADMPAAVISHATMEEQKTCVGTLETIVEKVQAAGLTSPALIAVGEVISLRNQLEFWEKKQEMAHNVLIPRIGSKVSGLVTGLEELGAKVHEVQVGCISNIPDAFSTADIEAATWIVLTSKHSIRAFFQELKRQKIDYRKLSQKKFAVVGEKTAQVLEENGFYPDLMPEVYTGEVLCDALKEIVTKEDVVLYGQPRGIEHPYLEELGELCSVKTMELYENQNCETSDIDAQDCDYVCFSCASAVSRLWDALNEASRERLKNGSMQVVSIGPKTSEALRSYGVTSYEEAKKATYEDMVQTYERMICK